MSFICNYFACYFITFQPAPPYNKLKRAPTETKPGAAREDELDYLPEIYQEFRQQFPEIAAAYGDLAVKCHEAGPLDEKTRRLVKLGVAVGVNSEGGVRSHARRALDEEAP